MRIEVPREGSDRRIPQSAKDVTRVSTVQRIQVDIPKLREDNHVLKLAR
jgi:hypothetical protein